MGSLRLLGKRGRSLISRPLTGDTFSRDLWAPWRSCSLPQARKGGREGGAEGNREEAWLYLGETC